MNLINQINGFLAKSIGLLNALLAILLVGFALMVGVWLLGTRGIFVGPAGRGGHGRSGVRTVGPAD